MPVLEDFLKIWRFPLFSIGANDAVTVSQIVLVIFVAVAGYLLSRLIARTIRIRLARTHMKPDVAYALQRVSFYTLLVLVGMTVLSLLRIPLTAFAFVSGAIAIGVGFGAQNIINNFISSWILMTERPVRIGDFIEIDDSKGVVEEIGNRSTRIRRVDGVHLLVPNSQMLERKVTNWTLVDRDIRSVIRVGVAYGSPTRKVAELIHKAVKENRGVKKEPEPVVIFEDFGDSALIFEVYFWAELSSEREQRTIRSDIRFRIDELFRENGIVIAFPQRDVHLGNLSPLEIRMLDSGE
jgi:small-conductance mechanosensitive channel